MATSERAPKLCMEVKPTAHGQHVCYQKADHKDQHKCERCGERW